MATNGIIKSTFLPHAALQGEEISSFILWSDIDYDKILVKYPECFNFVEIHNVAEDAYGVIENQIIINSVKSEGYLGLVFQTKRSGPLIDQKTLVYSFMREENIVVESHNDIILFRPEIKIDSVPQYISINEEQKIFPKIRVQKLGGGTCNLWVKTTDKSKVQTAQPKRISEFFEKFLISFIANAEALKKKTPDLAPFLDDLVYVFQKVLGGLDPSDDNEMQDIQTRLDRLDTHMDQNEKHRKDIARMYASAAFSNIGIITMQEQFIDYLESIEKNQVSLINALDIIELNPGENSIELELHSYDLLMKVFPKILLDPIIIHSDSTIDVSVFNLFEWIGGT